MAKSKKSKKEVKKFRFLGMDYKSKVQFYRVLLLKLLIFLTIVLIGFAAILGVSDEDNDNTIIAISAVWLVISLLGMFYFCNQYYQLGF